MILINEWLPNPLGNDATGEWIELKNDGAESISLRGWAIEVGSTKKKIALQDKTLAPGEFFVLRRVDTKFVLRNSDETLTLYSSDGKIIDQSVMRGQTQEGKSVNPRTYGIGEEVNWAERGTFFADPTPGAENKLPEANQLASVIYQGGGVLSQSSTPSVFLLAFCAGLACAVAVVFIIKNHESLSNLFFRRDQEAR